MKNSKQNKDNDKVTGIYRGKRTLSIMPTFQCNANCKNCGTLSSPHVKDVLPIDIMLSAITEAAELGFGNVVFTGGEATLQWDQLLKGLEHAKSLGLITRLVSNAGWAKTKEVAQRKVQELKNSGLDEINFSTGDEHIRFVPMDFVVNAVVASHSVGIKPHVMIEFKSERKITKEIFLNHPDFAEFTDAGDFSVKESPWMPLSPKEVEEYPDNVAVNKENVSSCTGCETILQTITLLADQSIVPCCGMGMRLIPELKLFNYTEVGDLSKAIEKAENDFLKVWLRYEGPEKILAWAAEIDSSIKWENMYGHYCQVCLRIYKDPKIRKVIKDHYMEKMPEVISSAFMDEVVTPDALSKALKS